MIKVDADKTIRVSRGDGFSLNVSANGGEYEFQLNDVVRLRVYNKKGYEDEPLLDVSKTVTDETTSVTLNVTKEQNVFSGDINKPMTYWYEISLNEDTTIIGYDEDGAKLFIVYPAEEGVF